MPEEEYPQITIDHVDIDFDEIQPKHFKEEEDPKVFRSIKTNRSRILRSLGIPTKVEDFIHKCIREVLLLGHRQAFTWVDQWFDMDIEAVREYEKKRQEETDQIVLHEAQPTFEDIIPEVTNQVVEVD